MSELKGKKLLLLGGVMPACEIVKEAQKMGVMVYVTDYLENSPAKKYADKSFMVSATDVDAVVELCKNEGIDGVITGYVDSLLPYCEQICKKLGLPFWGNAENIEMCINKAKFKTACEKSGLPVVPWKKVNRDNYTDMDGVQFPVVIKPVDNSGSRGVFKCYKQEDYKELCEQAFAFSKEGELLIERLMDANSEFSVYYMIDHGQAILTGMGDRYVNITDETIAPIGQGMYFPSLKLSMWKEKMHLTAERFFAENDMNEGFVFIQGFFENGEFYIHEIGYRLNGGFSYKIIEHYSGYNQVQQLIRFSLLGSMDSKEVQKSDPEFDGCGFIFSVSLKRGEIGDIKGVEDIEKLPGVLGFYQLHMVGDKLVSKGTTAQVFAYILCAAASAGELDELIVKIKSKLSVLDSDGNDMIYKLIDPKDIKKHLV